MCKEEGVEVEVRTRANAKVVLALAAGAAAASTRELSVKMVVVEAGVELVEVEGCLAKERRGRIRDVCRQGLPVVRQTFRSNGSSRTNPMEYTSTGDSSIVRACLCGFEVVIRTSWTNSNPGRRFRSCPGDNGSYCGVFQWIDPPMCLRAKEIIHGLLSRLNDQEKQLNEYRQKDFKKEALEGNLITYNLMGIVAFVITFMLLILYIRATVTCM
ncbi:UNVERIFIED_CONTAM: hypothetical protein Scaly_1615900 [Sesamum calycinum]|uniref:GRF-type domain-containing protein n=1 Tax=Sesamum calycinum TaxID=2727403 RepID=A0AAW2PB58_9LAMI